MGVHSFSFPTAIQFGPGSSRNLGHWFKEQGIRAPQLVTDQGVAKLDICDDMVGRLESEGLGVSVFDGIVGNPVESQVTAGVEHYRQNGCDGILAFGGGAAMDVAKAIALMVHHPGSLFDYEDEMPGARAFDQEIPVIVAVPTTAGTGSEVGRSAVISTDDTGVKKIVFSPRLLPVLAILDPLLILDLPASISVATGLDALSHNVEGFLAKGFQPMCDGIALEGVRMISQSLAKTLSHPGDVEARGQMLLASMMGSVAFQKGLGVTHSLAHSLSTVFNMHHGLANAIMLPYAMAYNAEAVPERLTRLAQAAGLADPSPEAFVNWLKGLQTKLKVPATLGEAGVDVEANLAALSQYAFEDGCHGLNPRSVSESQFRQLFIEAK